MNLLEKVKTGKLEGEYWVKLKKPSGEYIERIAFSKGLTHIVTDPYIEILEILAPCNYEELQRLKEDRNCYKNAFEKADKEITELVALLKECKANFIHRKQLLEKLEGLEKPTIDILTRINTAIGESEG